MIARARMAWSYVVGVRIERAAEPLVNGVVRCLEPLTKVGSSDFCSMPFQGHLRTGVRPFAWRKVWAVNRALHKAVLRVAGRCGGS